jgi:DNA repair protein RecN (Recombination protein N)
MNDASAELTAAAGGRAVVDTLRSASRHLQRIADKAPGRLDEVIDALERAVAEAAEAEALLKRAASDADLDPRRLEQVEERLFALRALARKHNTTVDGLDELRQQIASKLASIESGAGQLEELDRARGRAATDYASAAERLSGHRQDTAGRLDHAVAAELVPLRLGSARFMTSIERLRDDERGPHGCDRVSFQVVTNPGTPPGPLARIASGGELARFMLALKVVLARADPVPTLVFDEVDAGIGGAVAAAVGDRLAILGRDVQVVVVTHSPQVAARGQHHWRIRKTAGEAGYRTSVDPLDIQGRREEIARMLAGAEITDEARAAAESLLSAGHA